MAYVGIDFSNDKPTDNEFGAVPAGDYIAMCVSADWTDAKNGGGRYIQCVFKILDGPFANRQVWHRFNLINPNQTAVNISRGHMASLLLALGRGASLGDTGELCNIPIQISVKVKSQAGYDDQSEVTRFRALQGQMSQAQAPFGQPAAQPWANPPAPAPVAQPWANPPIVQQQAPAVPWTPPIVQQTAPAAPWTPPPPVQQQAPAAPWTPPAALAAPQPPVAQNPWESKEPGAHAPWIPLAQ